MGQTDKETMSDKLEPVEGRKDNKDFLRTEPLGKLLVKLALPTVAAQLINMLYNIVDRIYIGHIPEIGATALTGVGVCMPLILIVRLLLWWVMEAHPERPFLWGNKIKNQQKKFWETVLHSRF